MRLAAAPRGGSVAPPGGHVGDGYIDFPTITGWVRDAGYDGPVEVEISTNRLGTPNGDVVLSTLGERYLVQPHLDPAR